jgi:hypothetical protein
MEREQLVAETPRHADFLFARRIIRKDILGNEYQLMGALGSAL